MKVTKISVFNSLLFVFQGIGDLMQIPASKTSFSIPIIILLHSALMLCIQVSFLETVFYKTQLFSIHKTAEQTRSTMWPHTQISACHCAADFPYNANYAW
jgi:hypothetical protein